MASGIFFHDESCNVIKRVFHFTYLGIVFDDRLSRNEQIKYLISKAGKRVGMLGRLRRSLTRESANVVYCSLIRPILEYCVSVWGCCGEGRKHDLEALQNRAARIVATTVRSKQAMDVLKWPTLEERRGKSVFKLVKKCLQGRCPQYLDNILNVIIQSMRGKGEGTGGVALKNG